MEPLRRLPATPGNPRPPGPPGFSLVEALAGIIVTATIAFMFSTGFSSTQSVQEASRTSEWSRRLATIQVGIFQRFASGTENGTAGPRRRSAWSVPAVGSCAAAAFPTTNAADYWLTGSADLTASPRPPALSYHRPSPSPLAAPLHIAQGAGAGYGAANAWNVLNTCNGVPRWLGDDLATVTGMGFTVEFHLANLRTSYTRTTASHAAFVVPPPDSVEWYVLEVIVYQNSVYVHSVMLIVG